MRTRAQKRKKVLDHFAVVTCEGGGEPVVAERWPPAALAPYELPPALPYFAVEQVVDGGAGNRAGQSPSPGQRPRRWFGGGGSKGKEGGSGGAARDLPPRFIPFVLTGASGERIYGGALLRFYESTPAAGAAPGGSSVGSLAAVSGPPRVEALCFLSRFPFFSLFHDLLEHLHLACPSGLAPGTDSCRGGGGGGGSSTAGGAGRGREGSAAAAAASAAAENEASLAAAVAAASAPASATAASSGSFPPPPDVLLQVVN